MAETRFHPAALFAAVFGAAFGSHLGPFSNGRPGRFFAAPLPVFTRFDSDRSGPEPTISGELCRFVPPEPVGSADGLGVRGNAEDEMHHMKLSPSRAILVLVSVLGSSSWALADGDPAAGQRVFATHCATCHATEAGQNKIGPSLAGIVGSKSGTVPGFNFSAGMKNADITWDDAELDKFLANPAGDVHGTKMFINLPSEGDRQNVIAYLHTLKK
jgi:cytochrome c